MPTTRPSRPSTEPAFGTRPAERLARHGAALTVLLPGFAWVALGDTRGVAAIVAIVVLVGGAASWALERWRPALDRTQVVVRYLWAGPAAILVAVLTTWPLWDGYALVYAPVAALMGLLLVPLAAAVAVTIPLRVATAVALAGPVVATGLVLGNLHLHRALLPATGG